MKNKILNMLVGQWITASADSRLLLDISLLGNKPVVKASDLEDKEVYRIKKLRWDGRKLSFELVVPSTGYTTASVIRPVSHKKFIQRISYDEIWKRRPNAKK